MRLWYSDSVPCMKRSVKRIAGDRDTESNRLRNAGGYDGCPVNLDRCWLPQFLQHRDPGMLPLTTLPAVTDQNKSTM